LTNKYGVHSQFSVPDVANHGMKVLQPDVCRTKLLTHVFLNIAVHTEAQTVPYFIIYNVYTI